MKRPTNRRTVLMAAGAAALAVAGGTGVAQAADIHGAVTFQGGKAIPEGVVRIYLEDPAIQNAALRRVAETTTQSDGASKAIDFSLPQPEDKTALPKLQIVARLERADGWLLARGSTQITANAAIDVTLNIVVY